MNSNELDFLGHNSVSCSAVLFLILIYYDD
jgi:hypothetical protein